MQTVLFIAQPVEADPRASLLLVVGIVAVVALFFLVWAVRSLWSQRAQRRGFVGLIDEAGFEPMHGREALGRVAHDLGELFDEQAMHARQVRVAGALRRVEDDGLELTASHVVLGIESNRASSNANITTLNKFVLMVSGFEPRLPGFSLTPNHFLFATVQKTPVFHHTGKFGSRNLVLGDDKWFIAHVIGENVRELLAGNDDLVVESLGDRLAFYLHDERVQPGDVSAFVERCVAISRAMIANAPGYRPIDRPRRMRAPLLPA